MDEADFEKYTQIAELIPGKINGLVKIGIGTEELAQKFGVLESSVRVWRLGAAMTENSLAKLDKLVGTVDGLIDQGNKPKRTASLLRILDFEYPNGFGPEATTSQKIAALSLAGFSNDTIAHVTRTKTVSSVSNWLHERSQPKAEAAEKLDDLRYAMNLLAEAGLEPDTAAVWLQSPLTDKGENIPLDELGHNPETVFKAIDILFVRPYEPK